MIDAIIDRCFQLLIYFLGKVCQVDDENMFQLFGEC